MNGRISTHLDENVARFALKDAAIHAAIHAARTVAKGAVALALLLTSSAAFAQSDIDGDLVDDFVDNCRTVANGPNQTTNQIDSDSDGYGNRCDTDYNQDLATTVQDFARLLDCLNRPLPGGPPDCPETDHDGNGSISIGDFSVFLAKISAPPGAPGPSGLTCAGQEPCRAYFRRTLGGEDLTPGLPNSIRSMTDFDVVALSVPPGNPGEIVRFRMIVGAPDGLCADGAHCYADGQYAIAGWSDLTAAEASPTQGTLFHVPLDGASLVVDAYGATNNGEIGGPTFPTHLLTTPVLAGTGLAICPATGCVVALLADVSAAPGLLVHARTSLTPLPAGAPGDRAFCPAGCEGGLPVGPAAAELIVRPLP